MFSYVSAQSTELLGIEPNDIVLDASILLERIPEGTPTPNAMFSRGPGVGAGASSCQAGCRGGRPNQVQAFQPRSNRSNCAGSIAGLAKYP